MVLRSFMSPVRYGYTRFGDNPFAVVQRALQNSLEDAFQNLPATTEAAAMSVRLDVKEDEKAFHVTAELPGLTENEVEVTFDDGLLSIRGEKKIVRDEKKDTWHVTERTYGSFARQISLGTTVDADKIEAKFDKGVLNITLPKMPEEKTTAKKIAIKAN